MGIEHVQAKSGRPLSSVHCWSLVLRCSCVGTRPSAAEGKNSSAIYCTSRVCCRQSRRRAWEGLQMQTGHGFLRNRFWHGPPFCIFRDLTLSSVIAEPGGRAGREGGQVTRRRDPGRREVNKGEERGAQVCKRSGRRKAHTPLPIPTTPATGSTVALVQIIRAAHKLPIELADARASQPEDAPSFCCSSSRGRRPASCARPVLVVVGGGALRGRGICRGKKGTWTVDDVSESVAEGQDNHY